MVGQRMQRVHVVRELCDDLVCRQAGRRGSSVHVVPRPARRRDRAQGPREPAVGYPVGYKGWSGRVGG